jgi:Superinfection immunity protein
MPGRPMRQVWRDTGYGAKIAHFGFLAIVTIVTIILSARDTLAVKPQGLPQRAGNGGMYFVVLAIALYFLPSFAAWRKRNWGAICLLNLLLGWTLIGWIVALAWGWAMEAARPKSIQAASGISPEFCVHSGNARFQDRLIEEDVSDAKAPMTPAETIAAERMASKWKTRHSKL